VRAGAWNHRSSSAEQTPATKIGHPWKIASATIDAVVLAAQGGAPATATGPSPTKVPKYGLTKDDGSVHRRRGCRIRGPPERTPASGFHDAAAQRDEVRPE
jgi:hypothetical protein